MLPTVAVIAILRKREFLHFSIVLQGTGVFGIIVTPLLIVKNSNRGCLAGELLGIDLKAFA